MADDFDRVLCAKNEVFIYKLPPRQTARGFRAADWKLDQPDWTGRLRIVQRGHECIIKLEDKISGELFAKAPVAAYPGPSVEAVLDSSRYFVVKIVDDSGRHAFVGVGFADRGDSFDFNVTLQDFFKKEKVEEDILREADVARAPLDLGFKEGQTIKINIGSKPSSDSRPKQKVGGNIGLLPPPPGGSTPLLVPPPAASPVSRHPQASASSAPPHTSAAQHKPAQQGQHQDEWGDFASSNANNSWVQF